MTRSKTILAGYSGHGFVVAEAASLSNIKIDGYLEPTEIFPNYFELKYLGYELDPEFDWEIDMDFIIGIGDNFIRKKLGELIRSKGQNILNIFHPDASISNMITIGFGNFIARNAAINPIVQIGDFCIVNTGAIIEHECVIGNAVHLGPGAILAGNVKVGENTFIGANSVIKQGLNIGENVIVGAGSTVVKDIPDNQVWVGNPAKLLKK